MIKKIYQCDICKKEVESINDTLPEGWYIKQNIRHHLIDACKTDRKKIENIDKEAKDKIDKLLTKITK